MNFYLKLEQHKRGNGIPMCNRAAHKYYLGGSVVVLYFIKARYNLLSKKKHARYNLYKAFRIPTQLRKLKKRGINDKY